MTLAPGTRLGPYEILAPLGAGGMGEVWKAKDARLDRFVAIKVLPEHLTANPDALARFEREAKAVAALNHPNITAIHDLGQEGPTRYAVMELLEGESLRARLAQGPLPPRKAVDLAVQMAHGLAAAHEKGVVHRDLKPENLWITRDGRLKILDFGLAKQVVPTGPGSGSNSLLPTEAYSGPPSNPTQEGMILGTAGYMSPEQVRGEAVDARSDLFSFGVVLYEMLTGRKAFARGSAMDTLAAILKEDPADLEASSRPVPPGLQRILHRCLEKDPSHRFHDAEDLAFALSNLGSGAESTPALATPFAPVHRRTTLFWGGVGGLGLLAALGAGWMLAGRERPQPTFRKLTYGRGAIDGARFVPGSRDIAFSARWQSNPSTVYLLREGSLEARALEVPGALLVETSAKGGAAVLQRAVLDHGQPKGTLAMVPLGGGGARAVADETFAADIGEDGSTLCTVTRREGTNYLLQWPAGETLEDTLHMPRSPRIRGDRMAYFLEADNSLTGGEIRVRSRGGAPRVLSTCKDFMSLAWGPGVKEIWFSTFDGSESRLLAVTLGGKVRTLARHPGRLELLDVDPQGRVLASLSSHLRQAFGRAPGADKDVDLTWLDAQAPTAITADGSKVLVVRFGEWSMADASNLYLLPSRGGSGVNVGTGSAYAALSADGRWIVTCERRTGGEHGLKLIPTGTGSPRTFLFPKTDAMADTLWFSPDARKVYFTKATNFDLDALDLDTGARQAKAVPGYGSVYNLQEILSPDGKRFLYQAADARPPAEGAGDPLVAWQPGDAKPRPVGGNRHGEAVAGWAENNRDVYVWNRNILPAQVDRLDTVTGARKKAFVLMPPDPSGVWGIQLLKITPSGNAYAYGIVRKLSDLYLIEGLK